MDHSSPDIFSYGIENNLNSEDESIRQLEISIGEQLEILTSPIWLETHFEVPDEKGKYLLKYPVDALDYGSADQKFQFVIVIDPSQYTLEIKADYYSDTIHSVYPKPADLDPTTFLKFDYSLIFTRDNENKLCLGKIRLMNHEEKTAIATFDILNYDSEDGTFTKTISGIDPGAKRFLKDKPYFLIGIHEYFRNKETVLQDIKGLRQIDETLRWIINFIENNRDNIEYLETVLDATRAEAKNIDTIPKVTEKGKKKRKKNFKTPL